VNASTIRDKRIATGLLLGFLMVFYIAAIGTEYGESIQHGYGSGFSNQQYVSPVVVKRFETKLGRHIPSNITAPQLAKLTNKTPDVGIWGEIWRWAATVAALVGLLWFWHAVISRIGAI
jgi:hypothetical protein